MEAEELLRRHSRGRSCGFALILAALGIALTGPAIAKASEPDAALQSERRTTPALHKPRRVTIGNHNHFMGVLGPGGRYLYYVTDEFNAYDLFVQSPVNSPGRPLFEAFGDITWPAISPDAKRVAYIRYETDAQGDACRRKIRSNGKARNDREDCHATDGADLQIYWRKDGRLGVLLREELHGDHILLDGALDKHPERKEANVVGLALSPDERWVAYIPLARLRDEVGVSFSNQVGAEGIRIRRAIEGAEEFSYKASLPGVSGYPVFSPDGRYLYFSQFLNDTNRDGLIDGDDNGVLFRMPFQGDGEKPEFGMPRQLTNARWNCHYPSVREKTMALTCAIDGNLHIYLLPPSGAVPSDWDDARIEAETETVRDRWSELMLRQHLLAGATNNLERSAQLKALTKLHLDLREHEAATYYGEQREALLGSEGVSDWWSELIVLLATHRRADRGLSRGRFSEEYVQDSIQLVASVKAVVTDRSPDSETLRSLVLGRIYNDLGDKAAAAALLDRVDLLAVEDESVLDLAFEQFDHFYGLLADYDTRLARLKEVALHPNSSVTSSLRHGKAFIDLLQRGRPSDQRLGRLIEARETVPGDTRLALALDLEIALYQLTEENAEAVQEQLVQLFTKSKNAHVRRYLVISALRAAHRQGVQTLQQSLVELWVESAEQDDPDRKASTALYRLVALERAYAAFAAGDFDSASRYFGKAARATNSLAGYVGWIETQALSGSTDLASDYKHEFSSKGEGLPQSRATRRFVEAYLSCRDLGSIASNKELVKTVDRAQKLLESAIEEDPQESLSHLLLAYAVHHRGTRLGSRDDIAVAVRHYLLTADLARKQPRVRASAHAGMANAQATLGNHRRALGDYEARFELPMVSLEEEVGLLLNYARSLFHVNKQGKAIEALADVLALMDSGEEVTNEIEVVAQYEPLILDRLGLYQLDAGRFEEALWSQEQLQQSLQSHPSATPAVNDVKTQARLATANLAAGHPEDALRAAIQGQVRLDAANPLRPEDIDRKLRPVTHKFVYDEEHFRVLLAGLEASAARKVDDFGRARGALLLRKDAIEARYAEEPVDEDLLELAHACLRLAEVAQLRRDLEQTRSYLEEGLAYAEQHAVSTGSDVSEVGFHLLRAYAQLHFLGGVDLASYQRDLEQDLLRYYLFLSEVRNPDWERERKRFEVFLSLLRMETGYAAAPRPE